MKIEKDAVGGDPYLIRLDIDKKSNPHLIRRFYAQWPHTVDGTTWIRGVAIHANPRLSMREVVEAMEGIRAGATITHRGRHIAGPTLLPMPVTERHPLLEASEVWTEEREKAFREYAKTWKY